jgi:hypothetical protein
MFEAHDDSAFAVFLLWNAGYPPLTLTTAFGLDAERSQGCEQRRNRGTEMERNGRKEGHQLSDTQLFVPFSFIKIAGFLLLGQVCVVVRTPCSAPTARSR